MRESMSAPNHTWALLSHTEKWTLLRKIPWQLSCHLFLIILLTFQCIYFSSEEAAFKRMAKLNFANYFLPGGKISSQDEEVGSGDTIFFDVDRLISGISSVVNNYYTIQNESATYLDYAPPHSVASEVPPPMLYYDVFSLPAKELFAPTPPQDLQIIQYSAKINRTSLGPFDVASNGFQAVRDLVHITRTIRLNFHLVFFMVEEAHRTALEASFDVIWQWDHSGPFTVSMEQEWNYYEPYMRSAVNPAQQALFWILHALTFVLAVLHQIVATRNVRWDMQWTRAANAHRAAPGPSTDIIKVRSYWIQATAKDKTLATPPPNALTERMSVIADMSESKIRSLLARFWPDPMLLPILYFRFYLVNTVANFLCVWLFFRSSLDGARNTYLLQDTSTRLLSGLSSFFLWLGLLQWRGGVSQEFAILKTLRSGIPQVFKFAFGVAPIFFGYALFGLVYFGFDSVRFGYITDSMVTLFALMNGDAIRETFQDIGAFDIVTAQIYLYSFVAFFIYVVCAVFIVIMSTAFEQEEQRTMTSLAAMEGSEVPTNDSAPSTTTPLLRRSILGRNSINQSLPIRIADAFSPAVVSSSSSTAVDAKSSANSIRLSNNMERAYKAALREVLNDSVANMDELSQFASVSESFQKHLLFALKQRS